MSMLSVTGNLTADPELRSTASGRLVCNFSIAENVYQNGESAVQYFRCSVWGDLASTIAKCFAKGDKIHVYGRFMVEEYKDRNGVIRTALRTDVFSFDFCQSKCEKTDQTAASDVAAEKPVLNEYDVTDEEIPF